MTLLDDPRVHEDRVDITEIESVERSLVHGHRLLARVETFAAQLALPEIGTIELPPIVGSAADQALLRSDAPLYLSAELEATRLLRAAEVLAGVFASGGLTADLGPAAALLADFWRSRHQRFTQQERSAIFTRLFGFTGAPLAVASGRNVAFEPLLMDLAEELHRLHDGGWIGRLPPSEVSLRTAAGQLAANLVPRSGGIAVYAARDILDAIGRALAIFKQAAVQAATGSTSPWLAVRSVADRYLGEDVVIGPHVSRGQSGMRILSWVAEILPAVDDIGVGLALPEEVRSAGTEWLQASLSLHEAAPHLPEAP
jgi:hypothetical protein